MAELARKLNVTLADLLPLRGVVVSPKGEDMPYRISERLWEALEAEAAVLNLPTSAVLRMLRDEIAAI